jgi:hypothetical protein
MALKRIFGAGSTNGLVTTEQALFGIFADRVRNDGNKFVTNVEELPAWDTIPGKVLLLLAKFSFNEDNEKAGKENTFRNTSLSAISLFFSSNPKEVAELHKAAHAVSKAAMGGARLDTPMCPLLRAACAQAKTDGLITVKKVEE